MPRLPNPDQAHIDPRKLTAYLLSPFHPVGRFKASFFASLGYSAANARQLDADLRVQHVTRAAHFVEDGTYGRKYEICAILRGPNGRVRMVCSGGRP